MKNIRDLNWKAAGTLYFSLVLLATPFTAHAYVDPSVSSYLVQAIASIVIAVGAFVAIYWRRAKKKVQNKLGIDENARKEKEDSVQVFSDDDDDD